MSDMWLIENEGNNLRFTTGGMTGSEGMDCYPGNELIFLGSKPVNLPPVPRAGHAIGGGATKGLVSQIQVGDAGDSATAGTIATDLTTACRLGTVGVTGDFFGQLARPTSEIGPWYKYWTFLAFWRYDRWDWQNTYWWFRNPINIEPKVRKGIVWHWSDNVGTNVAGTDDRVKVTSDAARIQAQALGATVSVSYDLVTDIIIDYDWANERHVALVYSRVFSLSVKKGLITSMGVSGEIDHGWAVIPFLYPANNPWEHPPSPS